MFDLDNALASWRRMMASNRAFTQDDLDELAQHVRDQVDALRAEGLTEKEAFQRTLHEMGDYGTAEAEYRKVYWGKLRRRHQRKDELTWRLSMLTNYLKIAFRTLTKQKGYTFINIAGLAVGLACFILIGLFVRFELSYDTFHEKADRIYRIANENPRGDYLGSNRFAVTPAPLADALIEEFPEVEYATQINKTEMLFEHEGTRFYEAGLYATGHFFDVFSFQLLQGNPRTALAEPNSIILTESFARKYFGESRPMGQSLSVTPTAWWNASNETSEMKVTGIVKDAPANSHFTFDYLISMASSERYTRYLDQWDNNNYFTYASLRPNHSLADFAAKLPKLAQKYLSQYDYYQRHPEDINVYFPQALTDIHLHSHINRELGINGDIKYVYLFSAVGLLILIIGCINYINLATARSVTRTREVGVRKVMGAHRRQLIGQFMSEAIIPSVLALLIAIALVLLLLPTFNTLTNREITLNMAQHGGLLTILLLIGLGVGILAGSYPALVMSGFHPVSMMRGEQKRRAGKTTLRNVLVVVQFSITILLVIGTIVIREQLSYIQSANTGVDRDHVVSIENKDPGLPRQYAALKQTLQSHPQILGVTASDYDPTHIISLSEVRQWEGAQGGERLLVYHASIQHDFVDVLGIELVEGRGFSEMTDEPRGLLINETLKRQLGWDTAVGKWINFQGGESRIIGVMKDFNFHSFHQEIAPLALYIDSGRNSYLHILVKLGPEDIQETVAFLSETMAEFSPAYPFEFQFLDDTYNNMYQAEFRLGSLFSTFTLLALFVACLGLLGLAAFTASQRTKEIGVRKVLGASQSDILILMSKDFTCLVLIAFVLAAPIGYLALSRWLQEFAYRISLGWGVFLIAGGAVLLIAWLTVSYQTIRAARANPVKSLRYE